MKINSRISAAVMLYSLAFFLIFNEAANGGEPSSPVQAPSPLIKIQPVDQFRGLCEAGDFFEAIRFFQKSTMQYKIIFVYDFVKKPSDSPELDFLFLDYLKEANDIVDQGSETQMARYGSMAELFGYFSKKYDIPLTQPILDPRKVATRRRDAPWDIKRKFAAGITTIEQALETHLPAQGKTRSSPAGVSVNLESITSSISESSPEPSAQLKVPSSKRLKPLAWFSGILALVLGVSLLYRYYKK